jgi:hypothetical protein
MYKFISAMQNCQMSKNYVFSLIFGSNLFGSGFFFSSHCVGRESTPVTVDDPVMSVRLDPLLRGRATVMPASRFALK